jgi:hypothetical protein
MIAVSVKLYGFGAPMSCSCHAEVLLIVVLSYETFCKGCS